MTQELSLEKVPASVAELHHKLDDLTGKLSAFFNAKVAQEEKLLSASEACKLFVPAISRLTLIRWTKADLLKEYRIGGRVYYKQSEIIEAAKHLEKYKSNQVQSITTKSRKSTVAILRQFRVLTFHPCKKIIRILLRISKKICYAISIPWGMKVRLFICSFHTIKLQIKSSTCGRHSCKIARE